MSKVSSARRLIAAVQLNDVRLVEAAAKTTVRSREEIGEVEVLAVHSARSPQGIREGFFYVIAALEVRITPKGGEVKRDPLRLKVEYELKYKVPNDFKATRAEINSFAKVNGVYNAWPYFREYVQSTLQKMNLPPLILPVYRIPSPPSPPIPSSTSRPPLSGHSPAAPQT